MKKHCFHFLSILNRERRNVTRRINICQLGKSTIPRISATHEARCNSPSRGNTYNSHVSFTDLRRGTNAEAVLTKVPTKEKETRIDGGSCSGGSSENKGLDVGGESNKVKATRGAERGGRG